MLFRSITKRANDFGLAYLHVIEPRIKGHDPLVEEQPPVAARELSKIFKGPLIAAGGSKPDTAEAAVARRRESDRLRSLLHLESRLPKRIKRRHPLNPYDRSTCYAFEARGSTDESAGPYRSGPSMDRLGGDLVSPDLTVLGFSCGLLACSGRALEVPRRLGTASVALAPTFLEG